MSVFSLFALPHDVVLLVLQQDSLGARELCYLELCCANLRRLVDDERWKQAFLHHRHCNALREPDSWKEEFARRVRSSQDWRQLVTTGLRRRRARLPRFIVKLLSGLPAPVLTHIVDPTDARCFSTISSALACARPFDRVLVRPGHYSERLTLEKTVQIIGLGKIGSTGHGPACQSFPSPSSRRRRWR